VFTIERDAKFGGPSHYSSFEEFREKKVHPGDLKASVTSGINRQLEPIRKAFEGDVECKRIEGLAYPEVGKVEKKKKVSDCQSERVGTRSLLCRVCRRRCTIHRRLGWGRTRNALRSTAMFQQRATSVIVDGQVPTAVVDASSEIVDGAP
jgi:tyrosyl-tRNA synthetase